MKTRYATTILSGLALAACGGGSDNAPTNVAPSNVAPSVSTIADQSTSANESSSAIAFTVSDEAVGSLAIDVLSDNPQLVPDDGLVLAGSDRNRSLTITPVLDSVGDAYLTVIVSDAAGLAADSTFLLTVEAQQKSLQQFTRGAFAQTADGDPDLVNAVEFLQDADEEDFADLLAQ